MFKFCIYANKVVKTDMFYVLLGVFANDDLLKSIQTYFKTIFCYSHSIIPIQSYSPTRSIISSFACDQKHFLAYHFLYLFKSDSKKATITFSLLHRHIVFPILGFSQSELKKSLSNNSIEPTHVSQTTKTGKYYFSLFRNGG